MNRLLSIVIVGLTIIAAAIVLNFSPWQANDINPPKLTSVSPGPTPNLPKALKLDPPTFDVVRVSPNGNAVIAGRAMPDSLVVNLDNGLEFGRTKADDRGEWVFVPEKLAVSALTGRSLRRDIIPNNTDESTPPEKNIP